MRPVVLYKAEVCIPFVAPPPPPLFFSSHQSSLLCLFFSLFPLFCYFLIEAEPIFAYIPMSKKASIGLIVDTKAVSAKGDTHKEEEVPAVVDVSMEGFLQVLMLL